MNTQEVDDWWALHEVERLTSDNKNLRKALGFIQDESDPDRAGGYGSWLRVWCISHEALKDKETP